MYQHAICLACVTGAERIVCDSIRKRFQVPALSLTWVREMKIKNQFFPHLEVVMPGYVFVFPDTLDSIHQIAQTEKVLHLLQYSDGTGSLVGEDLKFAQWVLAQNGQIGLSRAMMVGDEMVIIDGPMKDYEGRIKRIDKHNRYAQMEVSFAGITRNVCLGFQWMTFKDGSFVRWQKQGNG